MSLPSRKRTAVLAVLGLAVFIGTVLAQPVPQPGSGGSGGSTLPVVDTTGISKGSSDPTKILRFEVDGFTTGNTRVATWPNVSDTAAVLNLGQTWTQVQVFSWGLSMGLDQPFMVGTGSTLGYIGSRSEQTPDASIMATGTTSNSWLLMEQADITSDFAVPQLTNPAMATLPATPSTTQRTIRPYFGDHGRAIKTLTESAATSAVRIPIAASTGAGGTITFTAFAADATDQQTLSGVLQYAAVNKAATETCSTPTLTGTALNSNSTGTLTCTYACDTAPANAVDIQFNCVSSLTQTTLDLYWRIDALGASEPLPQ